MNKRKVMLDGMRVGTKLVESSMEGSVSISRKEASIIRTIMENCGAELVGKDLTLDVTKHSTMHMVLRNDKVNKNAWYLNLSGNPLTFFTASNIYGWPEADELILDSFKHCITYAQKRARLYFPQRVREAIKDLEINLSGLEFATYTHEIRNKDKILNAWDYMYRTTDSFDGEYHTGLEALLKVERIHKKHKSFCLAIRGSADREELYFMAYDKEKELRDTGKEVPDDIKNRLRYDLHMTSWWLQRKKLNVMKSLKAHIDRHWDSDWGSFVLASIDDVIRKTCLYHMFQFPEQDILNGRLKAGKPCAGLRADIPYEAYLGMLDARARFWATNDDKLEYLNGRPEKLLRKMNVKPMTPNLLAGLQLDGGLVHER